MVAYYAIVDMGSNGIRFSITDVTTDTVRALPAVFQERLGLSLYDVQWSNGEKIPIPQYVIQQVVKAFRRFKAVCRDFGVEDNHIRVLATEATRVALNSEQFLSEIKNATGWAVQLLSKEDEGRLGAFGIASSFHEVRGLCMDLGGGSTQLTWIYTDRGEVRTSDSSVSMPYGAAALTQNPPNRDEMIKNLKKAYAGLGLCTELRDAMAQGNLNLYLSGGGFRGWGFALMDQHDINPYPIPIINGFSVPCSTFRNTNSIISVLNQASERQEAPTMHRVSKRRASQIPAVASLVSCVIEALPAIHNVYFCQGGVREGLLFSELPRHQRTEHPLHAAAKSLSKRTADDSWQEFDGHFEVATCGSNTDRTDLLLSDSGYRPALAQAMYAQSSLPKDIRAAAALQSTVTGVMAGAHGLSHQDRAALSITLCERYGGRKELDSANMQLYDRLMSLVPEEDRWRLRYMGRVAAVIAAVYPAGRISKRRMALEGTWERSTLRIVLKLKNDEIADSESVKDEVEWLQKLMKKKHRQSVCFADEVYWDVRMVEFVE